jgi:tetratricopeptide (TPR) repeat protein
MDAVRGWAIHYPDDEPAQFFLGSALFHDHRFSESLERFERAWNLAELGRTAGYAIATGWLLRDESVTERWLQSLKRLGDTPLYWRWAGQTDFLRGDYEGAWRWFERLVGSDDIGMQDQGHAFLTAMLAEADRPDLALHQCSKHVAQARRWGRPALVAKRLRHLTYLESVAGDMATARKSVSEAAQLEQGPQSVRELATCYRLIRDIDGLSRLEGWAKELPQFPIFSSAREWIQGERALAVGARVCMLGYAWFQKTRKGFADVV